MYVPEPEGYLNATELDQWRRIESRERALEVNGEAFSYGESCSVYYDRSVFLGSLYANRGLHATLDLIINPASGAFFYEPVEIEVEE